MHISRFHFPFGVDPRRGRYLSSWRGSRTERGRRIQQLSPHGALCALLTTTTTTRSLSACLMPAYVTNEGLDLECGGGGGTPSRLPPVAAAPAGPAPFSIPAAAAAVHAAPRATPCRYAVRTRCRCCRVPIRFRGERALPLLLLLLYWKSGGGGFRLSRRRAAGCRS